MLRLQDFVHLPLLDPYIERLLAERQGLTVVAGLDLRPTLAPEASDWIPSGRATILRILAGELLEARPAARCIVVGDKSVFRPTRQTRRRVEFVLAEAPQSAGEQIAYAAHRQPGLLVIDRLTPETVPAALAAAQQGVHVLSQLDTILVGAEVARQLLDMGATQQQLDGLAWVLAVQRRPALCGCKRPVVIDPARWAELRRRYPQLSLPEDGSGMTFFEPVGCSDCNDSGWQGDVAILDVFCAGRDDGDDVLERPSLLPTAEYALHLGLAGYISLGDVLDVEARRLRYTCRLLAASERRQVEATAALERKVVELEAANRVLEQRTEALISLHDIGQALSGSTDLEGLAARVCRRAGELCGAERAILYFMHSPEQAEVLGVGGWDRALLRQPVDAVLLFGESSGDEPMSFNDWPPGVPAPPSSADRFLLRAGLRVPLLAQERRVGLMIVHTTQKSRFAPGEVALLRTFANQAAVAIQRAGLIEQLQLKIVQLKAAQAELVQKERLERELELARQVQQNFLPRTFPQVDGYRFAARNDPARQVGGDFYDVIALDGGRFGLVIADVSDKGMPAALYMALTRSLLRAEAYREPSPAVVLRTVNRLLLELSEPGMFVTVFYGVVDAATRRLTYARAGHDRPLLLRDGVQELGGQGTVLGLLDEGDFHLSEEQLTLTAGDRLVLYTDGLVDALSSQEEVFGRDRLKALLRSCVALPAEELSAAVSNELRAFQGQAEQFDDMTMVVVQVLPRRNSRRRDRRHRRGNPDGSGEGSEK